MPNYNPLIITAADWTVFLSLSTGVTTKLLTLESIEMSIVAEEELIYAVGEEDAVGNKQNSRKISGKISIQAGEIMSICALNGLIDATRILGATIAATAVVGGLQRTFRNVNINTDTTAIRRKDKETITNCDFTALMVL